jgi:tetratricopeptide (TPR) repeat protein
MSKTPAIYYQYSEDFSYRKYMEEKSHMDRVVWSVDETTAAIVSGSESIVQAIGNGATNVSLSELSDVTEQGFTDISINLSEISSNVETLNAVCEYGFKVLTDQLTIVNNRLDKIIGLLETPEETWANEKFKSAQVCLNRGIISEALEFISLAIEGDSNNLGHKIEPVYHFTRGSILAGDFGTEETDVDLQGAIRDFKNSARYALNSDQYFAKLSLSKAAWLEYCNGNFEEAEEIWLDASKVSASLVPEVEFLLARLYLERDNTKQAKKYFIISVKNAPLLGFRAKNDPIYTKRKSLINEWLEVARSELQVSCNSFIDSQLHLETINEVLANEFVSKDSREVIKDAFNAVETLKKPQPLTVLHKYTYSLDNLRERVVIELNNIFRIVEREAKISLECVPKKKPQKKAFIKFDDIGTTILGGVFTGILFGPIVCGILYGPVVSFFYLEDSNTFLSYIWRSITHGLLGALFGLLIGPVVMFLVLIGERSFSIRKGDQEKLKQYQAEIQKWEDEVSEINAKKKVAGEIQKRVAKYRAVLLG